MSMYFPSVILILALVAFLIGAHKAGPSRLLSIGLACVTLALLTILGLRPG